MTYGAAFWRLLAAFALLSYLHTSTRRRSSCVSLVFLFCVCSAFMYVCPSRPENRTQTSWKKRDLTVLLSSSLHPSLLSLSLSLAYPLVLCCAALCCGCVVVVLWLCCGCVVVVLCCVVLWRLVLWLWLCCFVFSLSPYFVHLDSKALNL
jgi:hypothetical protein